jgi:hypothetical protein
MLTATTAAVVACQSGNNVEDPISDWPHGRSGTEGPISDWPGPTIGTSTDGDAIRVPSEGALDAGEASEPSEPIAPPDEVDFGGLLPPRAAKPELTDDAAVPDAGAPDAGAQEDASTAPDAGVASN